MERKDPFDLGVFFLYTEHMLSKDEIYNLAKLARIEITESDVARLLTGLTTILDYIDELKTIETKGVLELTSVTGLENVKRPDEVVMNDVIPEILVNAPEMKDGYFKVKAIL